MEDLLESRAEAMHKAVVDFVHKMCIALTREKDERKCDDQGQEECSKELEKSNNENNKLQSNELLSFLRYTEKAEHPFVSLTDGYVLYHLLHFVDSNTFMAVRDVHFISLAKLQMEKNEVNNTAEKTVNHSANDVIHESTQDKTEGNTSTASNDMANSNRYHFEQGQHDSSSSNSTISNTKHNNDDSNTLDACTSRDARKRNLLTLIRHMDNYAHSKLGMPYTQSIITTCSAVAIAEWGCELVSEKYNEHVYERDQDHKQSSSNDSNNKSDNKSELAELPITKTVETNNNKETSKILNSTPHSHSLSESHKENSHASPNGARQFDLLLSFFVTIMALSGKDLVKHTLQSLSREDQSSLSHTAQVMMSSYTLHPPQRLNNNNNNNVTDTTRPKSNSESDSPSPAASIEPSTMLQDLPQQSSLLSLVSSPTNELKLTSSSPNVMTTVTTINSTTTTNNDNDNNDNIPSVDEGASVSETHSRFRGLSEMPSQGSVDRYNRAALLSSLQTSNERSWETSADPIDADDAYYQQATMQLRRELAHAKKRIISLEAMCRSSLEAKESWESRYKHLIRSQASSVINSKDNDPNINNNSNNNSIGSNTEAAVLQQRIMQKDETIATLSETIESQKLQLTHFKEAAVAHEAALQTMKRKLKHVEEELVTRAREQRDALAKLTVSEDALNIQTQARSELERKVDELHSQLTILKATSQVGSHFSSSPSSLLFTANNNNNSNNGNNTICTDNKTPLPHSSLSSVTSTQSIDHVLELEHELDEMRLSRDDLQRQVKALERQLTSLPTPIADVTAMIDTYKAQIRQAEKEREEALENLKTATAIRFPPHNNAAAAPVLSSSSSLALTTTTSSTHDLSRGKQETAKELNEQERPSRKNNETDSTASTTTTTTNTNENSNKDNNDKNDDNIMVDEGIVCNKEIHKEVDGTTEYTEEGGAGTQKDEFTTLMNAARRNQALLSSLVMTYGYDNLLMYQRGLQLHNDYDVTGIKRSNLNNNRTVNKSSNTQIGRTLAHQQTNRKTKAIDYYNYSNPFNDSDNSASIMTRQRRSLEQGLLDSVINYNDEFLDFN